MAYSKCDGERQGTATLLHYATWCYKKVTPFFFNSGGYFLLGPIILLDMTPVTETDNGS